MGRAPKFDCRKGPSWPVRADVPDLVNPADRAYAFHMPTAQGERAGMQTPSTLKERYEQIKARIADAAARSGRRADEIILVAVTKYAAIEDIRALIELGQRDFGENRVQNLLQRTAQIEEFLNRRRELPRGDALPTPKEIRWHMIGHLQRNKARKVLELARLVHSVDSLRLAEEIQQHANRQDEPIEVLVQVNTSGEKSKYGIVPAATRHLVEQIETTMNIRVRGLMCMAPHFEDPQQARPSFERCRELFDDIRSEGVVNDRFNILSMGMTNDFEVAIECGANIVRVGSAIFGEQSEAESDEP